MAYRQQILVVATRTAACKQLVDALSDRAERGPASFHLLVPATPHGWAWLADMYSGGVAAEAYLKLAVARYREAGLELSSVRLGDPDPLAAVMDAVHFTTVDEVIVSTLPRHLSAWLRLSLPHRVHAVTGLPVTHVVGTQARLADGAPARRPAHVDRSVYLDGRGAARVLGLDEAGTALGTEGSGR